MSSQHAGGMTCHCDCRHTCGRGATDTAAVDAERTDAETAAQAPADTVLAADDTAADTVADAARAAAGNIVLPRRGLGLVPRVRLDAGRGLLHHDVPLRGLHSRSV